MSTLCYDIGPKTYFPSATYRKGHQHSSAASWRWPWGDDSAVSLRFARVFGTKSHMDAQLFGLLEGDFCSTKRAYSKTAVQQHEWRLEMTSLATGLAVLTAVEGFSWEDGGEHDEPNPIAVCSTKQTWPSWWIPLQKRSLWPIWKKIHL